jgi:hypothetical protein
MIGAVEIMLEIFSKIAEAIIELKKMINQAVKILLSFFNYINELSKITNKIPEG